VELKPLRAAGLIAAVVFAALTLRAYRQGKFGNGDLMLRLVVFVLPLVILEADPAILRWVFDELSFRQGGGHRILGATVLAVGILYLFAFTLAGRAERSRRDLTRLIENLALEQFRQAIAIDPEYADAHFHTGVALAELTRWQEAVDAYRQAMALPTLTVPDLAHQNLGLALYHLRKYPDAEQALRFAISLSPDMQAAYHHLGLVLAAEGRPEEARRAFTRARELGPDTPFGEAAGQRLRALGEEAPRR